MRFSEPPPSAPCAVPRAHNAQCFNASPNAPVLHSIDFELFSELGLYYALDCRVYSRLGCGPYLAAVPPVSQCPVPRNTEWGLWESCGELCDAMPEPSALYCALY